MYSLVLMMAMSDGAALPSALPVETVKRAGTQELNRGRRGCRGCCGGCYGCYGCYGWGGCGGGGGGAVYRSHYYGGMPVAGYQSYYPAQQQGYQSYYGPGAQRGNAPAQIVVSLPADARLSFDETPTQQTGAQRVFTTPALTPGYQYQYTLTATAVRDGKDVTITKQVTVTAGQTSQVQLDFSREVAQR